jgi:hypothetical protein
VKCTDLLVSAALPTISGSASSPASFRKEGSFFLAIIMLTRAKIHIAINVPSAKILPVANNDITYFFPRRLVLGPFITLSSHPDLSGRGNHRFY